MHSRRLAAVVCHPSVAEARSWANRTARGRVSLTGAGAFGIGSRGDWFSMHRRMDHTVIHKWFIKQTKM